MTALLPPAAVMAVTYTCRNSDGLVVPSYFFGKWGRNLGGHATARRCSASAAQPTPATGAPDCIRAFTGGLGATASRSTLRLRTNVETALSRPLDGDAGILSCAPAVELRPQVFCPCTPHCWGAHGRRRTALAPVVGYHRIVRRRSLPSLCRTWGGLSQMEGTVNVVPPLPQGVWRGCSSWRVAKQLPSRRQRSSARSLRGGP